MWLPPTQHLPRSAALGTITKATRTRTLSMELHLALLCPLITAPLPLLSYIYTLNPQPKPNLSSVHQARLNHTRLSISIRSQLRLTREAMPSDPKQTQELFCQVARPVRLLYLQLMNSFISRRNLASITAQRMKTHKRGK